MDEKKITVWVIAPEGRMISEYGSRAYGESFEVPEAEGRLLVKLYPAAFSSKAPGATSEEKQEDQNGR